MILAPHQANLASCSTPVSSSSPSQDSLSIFWVGFPFEWTKSSFISPCASVLAKIVAALGSLAIDSLNQHYEDFAPQYVLYNLRILRNRSCLAMWYVLMVFESYIQMIDT